ncbi:RHS repeat-associated core domain-containing protein [Lysobacter sp. Root604]|uniref:RHS repeat-associated core domain-containing protein n=1 Tax=Lysobacter sp. Root604 TaxID=1736568 RepID=UPI001F362860|nr:RHS repeat-associated core domain-containing protein [Lysobacter sp. Root604]
MNYAYNGKGEQTRRYPTTASTTQTYASYDEAGHAVGVYDYAGSRIQEVIWLGDLPIGVIDTNKLHYVQADHLGTPRNVIDPVAEKSVWAWQLGNEAFGDSTPNQDPDGNATAFVFDLRFPGQRHDAASGLNYNYFRDYDSTTGRYSAADPIGQFGGGALYGYVGGKVITRFDPLGLQSAARDHVRNSGYGGERGSLGGELLQDFVSNVWGAIGFDLKARKLTNCERNVLSNYYPKETLENVTVHGHLPWFMVDGFDGITIGNDIYLADASPDTPYGIPVLGHEVKHVTQQQSPSFIPKYLWGSFWGLLSTGDRGKAHDSIGMEVEGINMQDRIRADMSRSEDPGCYCR